MGLLMENYDLFVHYSTTNCFPVMLLHSGKFIHELIYSETDCINIGTHIVT